MDCKNNECCLGKGVKILTVGGYRVIEDIKEGEEIITDDYKIVKVTKIGRFKYTGILYTLPKEYHKSRPFEEMKISRTHKYRISGKWRIPKKHLAEYKVENEMIYHLEVEGNKNMIANGIVVESWKENKIL